MGDQLVRAVITPVGHVDPERELAVWRDLLETATICVYPGEQLRRMQPAILAVRLSTEILVVNTEHPRAIVRAAMKLLQPGALVPLPVAWMLDQARTRPGRTSAAVAGVAVALTLTLINYPASPVSRDRPIVAAVPSFAPSSAPVTDAPADAPTDNDPAPTPPHTVFQSAPPPTGAPRNDPPPDRPPDQDDPDDPNPRPTERSERQEKEDDENSDTGETPDRPTPTARPSMSAPPPGEDAAPTPRSSSPPDRPSSPSSPSPPAPSPTPAPTSDPPPSKPRCHVLDVDLPILDVCV
ncbi:hypothetical protein [Streptosporangium sp. NPDC002721]|uniref:hypothetical protein n=1 Tax=Streptosporangium sp. NPDC002721 TaxID=3366188 RepID=UPI0036CD7038